MTVRCLLVLSVRTVIASLVPSVKSWFPVNSQQLLPVSG